MFASGEFSAVITHMYTLLSDKDFNMYLLHLVRYWLPAGSSNILAVHVLWSGEQGDALWQRSGAPSTGWEVAEVTVSSPVKFHVSHCFTMIPFLTLSANQIVNHSESLNCILYFSVIPVRLLPKKGPCPSPGGVSSKPCARH